MPEFFNIRLTLHERVAFSILMLILLAFMLFQPTVAWAATLAAAPGTAFDFAPMVNWFIGLTAAILTAATPFLSYYLVTWLRSHKLLNNAQQQQMLGDQVDTLLRFGLSYAANLGQEEAKKHDLLVPIENPTVRAATAFAINQGPVLLGKMGYDVTTPAGQTAIAQKLIARLDTPLAPA